MVKGGFYAYSAHGERRRGRAFLSQQRNLDSRGVVRFLRDCFAWEFGNQSGQNLRAKSLRARTTPVIETVVATPEARPTLAPAACAKLARQLHRYQRSSDAMYGVFALCRRAGAPATASGALCAPLFVGALPLTEDEQAPVALATSLLVNRTVLNAVFDDDTAASVANALGALLKKAPWGRAQVQEIIAIMSAAEPELQTVGFERFPLLLSSEALDSAVRKSALTLVCTATAYVTRRSRQSMGVLHELEQMAGPVKLARPLRQLMDGQPVAIRSAGPMFALGALSTPQRNALRAAREHALSVVHGPPGTGKTHVLTMLILDQLARGQSVLVCARNDAAINVIERFVRDQLGVGEVIVRGGRFAQLSELKRRLLQILKQGFVHFEQPGAALRSASPDHLAPQAWPIRKALRKARSKLRRLDRKQDRLSRQIERSVAVESGDTGLVPRLLRLLQRLGLGQQRIMALHDLTQRWVAQLNQRNEAVLDTLQLQIQANVIRSVRTRREQLAQLARSFTAREHNQLELQASMNYRALTRPFPLWLSTLADLGQVAPLAPELFDLVIIDEASQADTASALPALQRARRAVIIGDACQLRHVSFIPRDIEARFAAAQSLNAATSPGFRDDSILEWANRHLTTGAASSFLDEHFRSAPGIIGFSNREFYADQLKLLTRMRRPHADKALVLHRVQDGTRGRNDVNRREVEEVVAMLVQQAAVAADDTPRTIGVLSPFRAQVDAIEKAARKTVDVQTLERHSVFFGTAHEWQGEERDVVLFSACIDDASAAGSLVFLSRPDVLNVAVTRARFEQHVFLSRSVQRLATDTLFGRYIDWVRTAPASEARERSQPVIDAGPIREVLEALASHPCAIALDYAAGSVRIDALLSFDGRHLGIDFIGFDNRERRVGLGRYELELMQRLATPIVAVTHRDWQRDRRAVVQTLDRAIAKMVGGAS